MSHPGIHRVLPGERVLWKGAPCWRALARDSLHIRLVALYFAVMLIWSLYDARAAGEGIGQTMLDALPSMAFDLVVLGAMVALAWGLSRTTRYTVTTERCMIEFGLALRATISIPWRRVAGGSIAIASDGTGTIPLTLKPGPRVMALKLWPHLRLRGLRPEPALRCIPDAERVGGLIAQAARISAPVRTATLQAALSPAAGD